MDGLGEVVCFALAIGGVERAVGYGGDVADKKMRETAVVRGPCLAIGALEYTMVRCGPEHRPGLSLEREDAANKRLFGQALVEESPAVAVIDALPYLTATVLVAANDADARVKDSRIGRIDRQSRARRRKAVPLQRRHAVAFQRPGFPRVVAAIQPAPGKGIDARRLARINYNVGDIVVIVNACAASEEPFAAVGRFEQAARVRAYVDFVGITRVHADRVGAAAHAGAGESPRREIFVLGAASPTNRNQSGIFALDGASPGYSDQNAHRQKERQARLFHPTFPECSRVEDRQVRDHVTEHGRADPLGVAGVC